MSLETDLANIRAHVDSGLNAVKAAVDAQKPPGVAELEALAATLQADLATIQSTLRTLQAVTPAAPN